MNTTNITAIVLSSVAATILCLQIKSGKLSSGDTLTLPSLFGLTKFPLRAYVAGQTGKAFCRLVNNRLVRKSGKKGPQTVYIVI